MNILEKLTVEDVCCFENISKRTAHREISDIKDYFSIKRVKFYHYLIYNKIDIVEYLHMRKALRSF